MKKFLRRAAVGILVVLAAQGASLSAGPGEAGRLRVLTINVWSGLDYEGTFTYGAYESRERRNQRFHLLCSQVRDLDPDVIFLQEANPAGRYARRLARVLGFDQIHKVVNGGIKFGPAGLPTNLKEGLAILARKSLDLRRHAAWKLSGPLGLYGDVVTLHFSEAVWALAGSIRLGTGRLFLVDAHLIAGPPDDEEFLRGFRASLEGRTLSEEEFRNVAATVKDKDVRRVEDARRLADRIRRLPGEAPVLIAGDFNAEEASPAIRAFLAATGAIDTLSAAEARSGSAPGRPRWTWNAEENENISYSSRPTNASKKRRDAYGLLDAYDTSFSRRFDYIFLGRGFQPEDILASAITIRSQAEGVHASDHFGVVADVDVSRRAKK